MDINIRTSLPNAQFSSESVETWLRDVYRRLEDLERRPVAGRVAGSPSSGGVSPSLPFVTIGNTPHLTAERSLLEGSYINITDGGPNTSVSVAVDTDTLGTYFDTRYLKLDASNDPVTGALDIQTDSANALRVLTAGGDERFKVSGTETWLTNRLTVYSSDNSATVDLFSPNTANKFSTIHLYDTGNQGWAIVKNPTTRDLWINKDTTYGGYVKTSLAIQHTTGRLILGPVSSPSFSVDAEDVVHVKGLQYTALKIDGTTNAQLKLAANGVNQWVMWSGGDTVLRWSKYPTSLTEIMTLTSAGALATIGTVQGTQLISTIATGTAPLTVASTTLVTNLNADLLDGQHASAFAASGNYLTALTGDVTATGPGSAVATLATVNSNVGSFTYASITVNAKGLITAASSGTTPVTGSGTAGRVAFWDGANSISSDAALFWDNANKRLGIGTATPAQSLQVVGGAIITAGIGVYGGSDIANYAVDAGGNIRMIATAPTWVANNNAVQTNLVSMGSGATPSVGIYGDKISISATGNVGIGETTPAVNLHVASTSATTNAAVEIQRIEARTTGTAGAGFGPMVAIYGQSASLGTYRQMAAIETTWATATDASRKARIVSKVFDTAARTWLQVDTDGATSDVLINSLIYGAMYGDDIARVVVVSAASTYYEVGGGLTGGSVNGMTFQNSKELLIGVAGKYLVTWSMSLAAGNNDHIEGAVMINSTVAASTENAAHTPGTNDQVGVGGSGILTLAVNDLLKLCVENETDTDDITVSHATLTAVRIGE